jgi:hypothetical protein
MEGSVLEEFDKYVMIRTYTINSKGCDQSELEEKGIGGNYPQAPGLRRFPIHFSHTQFKVCI